MRWMTRSLIRLRSAIAMTVASAVLGALLMFVGLAQAGRLLPERPDALVALGQKLEVEHRSVDILVKGGQMDEAIARLEGVRSGPWPTLEQAGEAAIQLRHDAYGRLVRVRMDNPQIDPQQIEVMLALVEEGLGADEDITPNVFTAQLWALRGEILQGEGRDDEALQAYEKALEINTMALEAELAQEVP